MPLLMLLQYWRVGLYAAAALVIVGLWSRVKITHAEVQRAQAQVAAADEQMKRASAEIKSCEETNADFANKVTEQNKSIMTLQVQAEEARTRLWEADQRAKALEKKAQSHVASQNAAELSQDCEGKIQWLKQQPPGSPFRSYFSPQ